MFANLFRSQLRDLFSLAVLSLLLVLSACSQSAGSIKVKTGIPIRADYPRNPASELYAYTVDMPEDIKNLVKERFQGDAYRIGWLLPVFSPEGAKDGFETQLFWCTLHNQSGELKQVVQVNVLQSPSGERQLGFPGYEWPSEIDWEGLAGYTSRKEPMAIARDSVLGIPAYLVAGGAAYSLNISPEQKPEETDGFLIEGDGLAVHNILRAP